MDKVQIYQELERRGELGKLPPEKQAIWAEYKRRQSPSDPAETPGQRAWNSFKEDIADLTYAPRKALSGATLGASDWALRKLGVGYEDTENRMGEVSPLAEGLTKVGGFGAELGGNIGGLGGGLVKYLAGKGLKGLKLGMASGGIEGLATGATSSDTLSELPKNVALGGIIGTGGGVLGEGLTYLARPFSARSLTKGMKGGLNNVVENPEAVKLLNQGIKQSDDVASEFLLKSRPVARGINKETANMVDSALTSRIDVPETIKEANARYGQYMDEHGADEVFNLAPTEKQLLEYPAESSFNPNKNYSRADALNALEKRAENLGVNISNDIDKVKKAQFSIISKKNPMTDDYHTGIRDVKDIKTWDEVVDDPDSFVWGDFSREQAKDALKNGRVKIYSSKPIKEGGFVSTSKNQAKDYAGNGKIYEKEIPLQDVAWINGDEGQYAPVEIGKGHLLKRKDRLPYARTLENTVNNYDIKFTQDNGNSVYSKKYDVTSPRNHDYAVFDENNDAYTKYMADAGYLSRKIKNAVGNISINGNVLESKNSGYITRKPKHSNNIPHYDIVVNSKLPHINSLYDGLTEFQGKSLKNALNTGFSKTNAKRGSLESLNKVKQEINEQIKKAQVTDKPSEVWQLEELKHKFDKAMPEGLKAVDKGYERAKRLENAFERGTHYNPNNVEGADYISELSPLEQNAFAQGLFKRINNNSLTGKNLANTALGYENTLASVLRGDKYDDLMKGLNKQSTKFERLAGLGRKAETKLNTPEAQRFFGREQLESKGSMIGSALDWLNTKFRHDALERAGKNLLNPNYVGDSEAWLIENYPIIAGYLSSKLNQEVNQ